MFLYVLINRRSFWIVRSAVSGSRLDALYSRWRHSAIINDMRRILLFLLLSLSVMPLQAAVRLLWSGRNCGTLQKVRVGVAGSLSILLSDDFAVDIFPDDSLSGQRATCSSTCDLELLLHLLHCSAAVDVVR